jgi:hypothetical protein
MATTVYPFVTATSGTVNTKGAYTQVTAATTFDSSRLVVLTASAGLAGLSVLLDVATGGAGSETVVISNISCVSDSDFCTGLVMPVDVDIPTGTRLAVRIQTNNGSATTMNVQLAQDNRALGSLTAPVTYGTSTANSRGTQVDPGGTINTKGAYAQLTASTTARIDALLLSIFFDTSTTTAVPSFTQWSVDVATGAAGSEVVVLADLLIVANSAADQTRPQAMRLPITIAAGTRLAVRCNCSSNTSASRMLRVAVVGMQEPATSGGGGATSVAYLG